MTRSTYNLAIVAVDEGVEDTRSATTTLTINLDDVNDNAPVLDEYPFVARVPASGVASGAEIVRVSATDSDAGANAALRYSFLSRGADDPSAKFDIDPVTGIISVAPDGVGLSAADNGAMFHLEVVVTDSGGAESGLSATGLVEVRVGDQPSLQLNFQQQVYTATIREDAAVGEDIGLQVELRHRLIDG